MQCQQCQAETKNPKFCSRSCAAKTLNVRFPKRKPKVPRHCQHCSAIIRWSIDKHRTSCCKACADKGLRAICGRRNNWGEVTLGDLAKRKYHKSTPVRYLARTSYLKSGRPQQCARCQYSKHIEVCHIQSVASFPPETPISVINDQNNLIALCPNCHWEMDNLE